jgi:hydrogenase maturation protein HypF
VHVALSGGCFQNALLTDLVRRRVLQEGFSVYTHRQVPPGDGGIALGQAYVAARQLKP